jgi:L-methionine (R)-S-oxide reductase
MAEELIIPPQGSTKLEKYRTLIPQIQSLLEDEKDMIANMANVSAVLKSAFDFLWVGFYIVKDEQLVLGPFQGPLACTRIDKGKGVCGRAWIKKESIIVPDVHQFPGHIFCSADSNSEIVIPGISKKKVIFVLDVDSVELNTFNNTDKEHLEIMVGKLIKYSDC